LEITEKYLMVASIFLALSYAYRGGLFIRVTFLVDRLSGNARLAADYFAHLITLAFCLFMLVATGQQALRGLSDDTELSTLPILVRCLLGGVPIAVALAGSGMFGIWLITGDLTKVMNITGLVPFSTVADYQLTTIPMFILMAYFSASSGLARDLYAAAAAWLSHIRGGLAIATVFACGVFGAMSGASVAAASVMSNIAMPEMRRHGYSEELAAGSIGVGATLDILIPPSIAMVIYGIATQTSIG